MSKTIKLSNNVYLDSSSIVHNKTKLSDILDYSLSERKVGKWIDGKTIYEATLNEITGSGALTASVANLNIDTMIDYNAMNCRTNDSQIDYEKPYYNGSTDYFRCFYRKKTSTMEIRIAGTYTTYKTRITLKYTKTTD